jgi:NACHT domain
MTKLITWLQLHEDDKLLLVIVSGLLGAVLMKLFPAIWAAARRLSVLIGKAAGGRFAFRHFQHQYLNWLVTEAQELKLAGIVTTDAAKKPRLEQVFLSIKMARSGGAEATSGATGELTDFGTVRTWRDVKELIKLDPRGRGEANEALPKEISLPGSIEARALRLLRWLSRTRITTIDRPEQQQVRDWLARHGHLLERGIGAFQLRRLLRNYNKVAILGGPGAGKTTLLQYITLAFARERAGDRKFRSRGILKRRLGISEWRVPVLIRLSSLTSLLTVSGGHRDQSILDVVNRLLPPDFQQSVATRFFRFWTRRGRCIFLFDGLDEVPTADEFALVIRAISSLAVAYPGNQFLITSRVVGWRTGVTSDFEILHVSDLSDGQVELFSEAWYAAVELNAVVGSLKQESPYEKARRERRAARSAADLTLTIRENLGIRRLAINPMLLSIIALVHRSLASLPKERAKLYSQCSRILLEQWDISRGVRVDDTGLKLEQKEALMRSIAFAFHTGTIGEPRGGREAPTTSVLEVIAGVLPGMGRDRNDASHLLQRLVERSGLLVEPRPLVLAFAHHTFQEYFTAQYLATGGTHDNLLFLLADERLLSDWWREVILLYSGLLDDSSEFIGRLLHAGDADLVLAGLRLAGMCLGEAVRVNQISLRRDILCRVFAIRQGREVTGDAEIDTASSDYLLSWLKTGDWHAYAARFTVHTESDDARFADTLWRPALREQSISVKTAALQSVRFMNAGPLLDSVATDVLTMATAAEPDLRAHALAVLEYLPQTVASQVSDLLTAAAKDGDKTIVRVAATVLVRLAVRGDITFDVQSIVDQFCASDDAAVRSAGASLCEFSSWDSNNTRRRRLLSMLADEDDDVRVKVFAIVVRSVRLLTQKELEGVLPWVCDLWPLDNWSGDSQELEAFLSRSRAPLIDLVRKRRPRSAAWDRALHLLTASIEVGEWTPEHAAALSVVMGLRFQFLDAREVIIALGNIRRRECRKVMIGRMISELRRGSMNRQSRTRLVALTALLRLDADADTTIGRLVQVNLGRALAPGGRPLFYGPFIDLEIARDLWDLAIVFSDRHDVLNLELAWQKLLSVQIRIWRSHFLWSEDSVFHSGSARGERSWRGGSRLIGSNSTLLRVVSNLPVQAIRESVRLLMSGGTEEKLLAMRLLGVLEVWVESDERTAAGALLDESEAIRVAALEAIRSSAAFNKREGLVGEAIRGRLQDGSQDVREAAWELIAGHYL